MPIISISIPDKLLKEIDSYREEHGYSGRSELIREALREFLAQRPSRELLSRTIYSIIVVLTSHSQNPLVDKKVIDLAHEHSTLIKSFYHQTIDDENCVNIMVVESALSEAELLAKNLRRVNGEKHVWLIPLIF